VSAASRILALAGNTVREAVRHRLLYALAGFAVLLIAAGVLLSTLSYVERERILQDIGLGAIRGFGAMIAIFVGVGLIHKEVERRTIQTILSKPVRRTEFLLGKYAGMVATLWLQLAVMALAFTIVSFATDAPVGAGHVAALGLAGVEFALLLGVATLFSSFTTPMLASLFSAGFYVVGHLTRNLRELGAQSGVPSVERATAAIHRILPDLESLNLSVQAVHGLPIAAAEVWLPVVYAALYVSVLLTLASFIFERRDFR
jgi:ABC-type transport system involved in multi-copper enzyme maturation permease subunit